MWKPVRLLALLAIVACCLAPPPALSEEICTFPTPPGISIEKELLISDLSVVNDPRATGVGAWSFGGLMTALAPADAAGFTRQWLDSFGRRLEVNGFPLPRRPAVRTRLLEPWMKRDGATSFAAWTPNLANAPFRLLAIVYRPDLGIVTRDGAIKSAGEARFVFTALDLSKTANPDDAPPLPFTVIFEYELAATDRDGVRLWAGRWHGLGRLGFGSDYNAALQAITDSFARRDGKPSLNQIRTNEALAPPWQLREFHLDAASGLLVNAPLKDTPHASLAAAYRLSETISRQPDDDLPKTFLTGSANIPNRNFRWPRMQITNNVLRHNFALRTCNGCHSAETGTKADDHAGELARHRGFRHISGRLRNERARLSEFMTGDPALVMDPTGKLHTFCDLKIRQQALHEALNPKPPAPDAAAAPDDLSVARKRRERTD